LLAVTISYTTEACTAVSEQGKKKADFAKKPTAKKFEKETTQKKGELRKK
jgi:hypothetical protein